MIHARFVDVARGPFARILRPVTGSGPGPRTVRSPFRTDLDYRPDFGHGYEGLAIKTALAQQEQQRRQGWWRLVIRGRA